MADWGNAADAMGAHVVSLLEKTGKKETKSLPGNKLKRFWPKDTISHYEKIAVHCILK